MPELQNPFCVGELCYLRGMSQADYESPTYFQWMNDYDVTRYLESGRMPNSPAKMQAYFESVQNRTDMVHFAICDKATNLHIGNVGLRDIHPVHHRASMGILIGEKAYWGKGYGSEAVFLIIDYGFRRLNLHSIYLGVVATHKAAVRAYEKVGFKIDGTDREAMWTDGKYHDRHVMSVLAHEHFARLEGKAK